MFYVLRLSGTSKRAAIAVLCAISALLGGCASETTPNTFQVQSEKASSAQMAPLENNAQRVAKLLAKGDEAYRAVPPNIKTLADCLRALEVLGARPRDSQADLLTLWRGEAKAALSNHPPYRGRLLGPAYTHLYLARNKTVSIEQLFTAGQKAYVAVANKGPGPVPNITVLSDDDQVVCSTSKTNPNGCEWVPLFTKRYVIDVHNSSSQPISIFLAIN